MKKSNLLFQDLEEIKKSINEINTDTLIIIIDLNIYSLYSKKLNFDKFNKKVILWKAHPGEGTKNFKEYEACIEFILEKGVHRNCHLVAIGGGALTDFAGFIAATLLRGIPWSIISTSLLSMIDASIGGKVAINSKAGKNLVGSFYHPEAIYFDESFLKTLPDDEFQSGLGELIKYAFLNSEIKELILMDAGFKKILKSCSAFKLKVTQNDFKESGERKLLNLGHTIGHALEYIYQLKHGTAVFWGMIFIFLLFENEEELKTIKELKKSLKLSESKPPWLDKKIPVEEIMNYIKKDKKMTSSEVVEVIIANKDHKIITKKIELNQLKNLIELKNDEVKKFVIN